MVRQARKLRQLARADFDLGQLRGCPAIASVVTGRESAAIRRAFYWIYLIEWMQQRVEAAPALIGLERTKVK